MNYETHLTFGYICILYFCWYKHLPRIYKHILAGAVVGGGRMQPTILLEMTQNHLMVKLQF